MKTTANIKFLTGLTAAALLLGALHANAAHFPPPGPMDKVARVAGQLEDEAFRFRVIVQREFRSADCLNAATRLADTAANFRRLVENCRVAPNALAKEYATLNRAVYIAEAIFANALRQSRAQEALRRVSFTMDHLRETYQRAGGPILNWNTVAQAARELQFAAERARRIAESNVGCSDESARRALADLREFANTAARFQAQVESRWPDPAQIKADYSRMHQQFGKTIVSVAQSRFAKLVRDDLNRIGVLFGQLQDYYYSNGATWEVYGSYASRNECSPRVRR